MLKRSVFICFLLSALLAGPVFAAPPSAPDDADLAFLKLIEQASFKGFESLLDDATGLPMDAAPVAQGQVLRESRDPSMAKTSPSHVALQVFYLILSRERGYLRDAEVYDRAFRLLDTLESMETHEGFLYSWYALSGDPKRGLEVTGSRFVPFSDNGLLDTALMALGAVYQGTALDKKIENFLSPRGYGFFYNQSAGGGTTGLVNSGYDTRSGRWSGETLMTFNQEARAALFLAVLKGDVPRAAWWNQERIVKTYRTRNKGVISAVSSWGGGLSEFLMPDEILGGDRIAPRAFGENADHVIQIQRDYGKRLSDSGLWGFSAGQVPDLNRYEISGVSEIAYKRYDGGFVVPYASLLAMRYAPRAVIDNLKAIVRFTPACLGRNYGFCDSLDPRTGQVNRNLLARDKGIEVLALGNYLSAREGGKQTADYFWQALRRKGWERKGMLLLKAEENHPSFKKIRGAQKPGDPNPVPASAVELLERCKDIGTFYDPDQARASYAVEDLRRGEKVLKVRYDVRKRYTFTGLYMKFRNLDVEPYKTVEFQVRGSESRGYPKQLKVELKNKGKHVQFEHVPLYGSWHRVAVVLPESRKQFDELVFVFENAQAGRHPRGEVEIQSLSMR